MIDRKRLTFAASVFAACIAVAQDIDAPRLIAEAVIALPPALRADATVILELPGGKRTTLRKGANDMICRADTPAPGFMARCYHRDMDAFFTRVDELIASRASEPAVREALLADVAAGKLKISPGATQYVLSGPAFDLSLPITIVFVPNATAQSTGLTEAYDPHRVSLAWGGTPIARIMIPGK